VVRGDDGHAVGRRRRVEQQREGIGRIAVHVHARHHMALGI
jgi:hypothetical protein